MSDGTEGLCSKCGNQIWLHDYLTRSAEFPEITKPYWWSSQTGRHCKLGGPHVLKEIEKENVMTGDAENWLSPNELRAIADYCETLNPLWDALTSVSRSGISIDTDAVELNVYDANGDKVGRITWGDGGPAFFADTQGASDDT